MRSRRITGNYTDLQENRVGWAIYTIGVQVYLLTPTSLTVIANNGNLFALWIPIIISSFSVVLCNLLSLPLKIVIPVFLSSIFISIADVMLSFVLYKG